jgi:hypothetical protein
VVGGGRRGYLQHLRMKEGVSDGCIEVRGGCSVELTERGEGENS